MIETMRSSRGAVSAPHHLAAEAGLRVLREGGNAIEAMVATAATIAVVYPHMNALGGDNFWLIHKSGRIFGIDACGRAAKKITREFYLSRGFSSIPSRGALSALTVAGAPSGWELALQISAKFGGSLPLDRLLEDAIYYAGVGVPVTRSLQKNVVNKSNELADIPGFSETFLPDGKPPIVGERFVLPALAETLMQIGERGISDFYEGELSRKIISDLAKVGSPLSLEDMEKHKARMTEPLQAATSSGTLYNMPPPTQGIASLIILSLFDILKRPEAETADYIHAIIEATKAAFNIRDKYVADPDSMNVLVSKFLSHDSLTQLASGIDFSHAKPWNTPVDSGDTVWMGAADSDGCVVSCIQSVYWEFGSGLVLPETGIVWQNRGIGFSLNQNHHNRLEPMRQPFHTIQPALANLHDGRVMAYGTMGGEGQPQTQAAIFSRYVTYKQDLQTAINSPRWLLGRTWGDDTSKLRLESRFTADVTNDLAQRGHELEMVGDFDDIMGHAGAVVLRPDGIFEAASDPRSDGAALGF
ncbi:MAG: gamma-glutamyltransferase family protein [Pseudomonadota bacterium]|nr:gamma-glutamyltransferase family protein [Pseudomonadota bacterium]